MWEEHLRLNPDTQRLQFSPATYQCGARSLPVAGPTEKWEQQDPAHRVSLGFDMSTFREHPAGAGTCCPAWYISEGLPSLDTGHCSSVLPRYQGGPLLLWHQSAAKDFLQSVPSDLQPSPKAINSFHGCTLDSQAQQQQGDIRIHLKAVSKEPKPWDKLHRKKQPLRFLLPSMGHSASHLNKEIQKSPKTIDSFITETQRKNLVSNISQFPLPPCFQISIFMVFHIILYHVDYVSHANLSKYLQQNCYQNVKHTQGTT